MAESGPGFGNVYVPTFSPATGQIQVEFSRNVKTFKLNRYVQIVPVQNMKGYYLKLDEEETIRVVQDQDYAWPIGQDRPRGVEHDHDFDTYLCERYAHPFAIPFEVDAQAQWDVVAAHARMKATQAMTLRTKRVATMLTTAGNWPTGTTSVDLDALGVTGGSFAGATVANPYIQQTIQKVQQNILSNTGGAVQPSDIFMIINPVVAGQMSASAEIRDLVKYYDKSIEFLRGINTYATWGLPDNLYGLGGIIVEDAVRATNRKGDTSARSSILGNNKAVFVSRPGGLVGAEGPTFSTVTIFAYEDMSIETMGDSWNRITKGSVVDNTAVELTAPLSGYLIQDTST